MEVTKWLKPSISVSRIGDSASVQAATRVNAEQASKMSMCRPTRRPFRGRLTRLGEMSDEYAPLLHRGSGGSMYTREAHATREAPLRDQAGGRPKGFAEVRELAREHTVAAIKKLVSIMTTGQSEQAQLRAANSLLDRGWGKPTQPIGGDYEAPPVRIDAESEFLALVNRIAAVIRAILANSEDPEELSQVE